MRVDATAGQGHTASVKVTTTTPDTVTISAATSPEDFTAVVELQRATWGAESAIVPVPQLIAAAHTGGVVLLADSGSEPVGFCYGFVGLDPPATTDHANAAVPPEPILWSHMLAVSAQYQGRGIGQALKSAQAEHARVRGLNRVLWTFDPLEARNAFLNLNRLGAVATRYAVDRYGPMNDVLNAGLASDRLIADWQVGSVAGVAPTRQPDPTTKLLNPNAPYGQVAAPKGEPEVRIEVPVGNWRDNRDRATAWRGNVRWAFTAAFDVGYIAYAVQIEPDAAYYLLGQAQ